jgi:signal transduction histidine kinase
MTVAAALAGSRLFVTGELPPIGLYVAYWALGTAFAGATIWLAYYQAVAAAKRLHYMELVTSRDNGSHDADSSLSAFGRAAEELYGLKLVACAGIVGGQALEEMNVLAGRELSEVNRAALSELVHGLDQDALKGREASIHRKKGLKPLQRDALKELGGETLVMVPVQGERISYGVAVLIGKAGIRLRRGQRRFLATLYEAASDKTLGSGHNGLSVNADVYMNVFGPLTNGSGMDEALESLASWVGKEVLFDRVDGVGVLLSDASGSQVTASAGNGLFDGWSGSEPLDELLGMIDVESVISSGALYKGAYKSPQEQPDYDQSGTLLAVPFKASEETSGVLLAARLEPNQQFPVHEEKDLKTAADQIGKILELGELFGYKGRTASGAEFGAGSESQLIHNLTHELTTSLSSLKAATGILLNEKDLDIGSDQHERLLQSISRNVSRQEILLANVIDMASLRDSSLTLKLEQTEVGTLISEVVSLMNPVFSQRGQVLSIAVSPELPPMRIDRQRISQVLVNFLSNAAKFSPEDSKVTLRAQIKGPEAIFSVTDEGDGVPLEERDQIFDSYHRVPVEGAKSVSGSGLGLTIARSLVELHRGSIWVEESAEGGAAFFVSIPIEGMNEDTDSR